jgi:hypothetical protein
VIRSWKRFAEAGATTAVQASEDVVPASHLRAAYAKIRELEGLLGKKQMEIEILQAAQLLAEGIVTEERWTKLGAKHGRV